MWQSSQCADSLGQILSLCNLAQFQCWKSIQQHQFTQLRMCPTLVAAVLRNNTVIRAHCEAVFLSPSVAAFENPRLKISFSGNRCYQLCPTVAGRFAFAHFRQEEEHSHGSKAGLAKERGGKRGEEEKSACVVASVCFQSNQQPWRKAFGICPFYPCSCMCCFSLSVVCLVLFWV